MSRRDVVTQRAREAAEDTGPDRHESETTRPALDKLHSDQRDVLHEGELSRTPELVPLAGDSPGFDSYFQLVSWYQAAAVRTLGRIDGVLPPEGLMPESSTSRYLTNPDGELARDVIRKLTERLQSACTRAYREFENRAEERTGTGSDSDLPGYREIDPRNEDNPGLRPGFRKLDSAQSDALVELWVGFDDRPGIEEWVTSLRPATLGGHDPNLLDRITRSEELVGHLTDRVSRESQLVRLRLLVSTVLPEFARAARRVTGSERSEGVTDRGGWKQA